MAKILVVDDDRVTQAVLAAKLKESGHQTVAAFDGLGAISQARRERPDLILLDIGLPAGDAFTVLTRLEALEQLALVPVIVVSVRDAATHRERALAAGAVDYFEKGGDLDVLMRMISAALGEP